MEDTIGLAGSLGLINRGSAAFGGNVLTRAADKALQMDAAEKKAEAIRLAKQAQEEKMLAGRMKVGGKFDDLARKDVEKSTNDMLMNKGYLDPQKLATYNLDMGRYEEATKERAAAKEILSKNKYLIPEADSKAFQTHDIAYLSERAKDPTSGITPDPNLPNVYRLATEKLIPKIDVGEALKKSKNLLSEGDYELKGANTVKRDGRVFIQRAVKPEALINAGQIFLENETNYKNFADAYKTDILKVMQANPTMEEPTAALKVYTDKLSQIGKIERDITPSKGLVINNTFTSDGKGSFSSKDKKINLTEVEPTATIKQGEYLYTRSGAKPDVVNLNVGGKDDAVKKFKDVTYVGKIDNTKGYVLGTRTATTKERESPEYKVHRDNGGTKDNFPARIEVPLSVIKGVLQIDEDTWNKLNSVGGSSKPAVKSAAKKVETKTSSKSLKMDTIKSKVGTKGFEGYTEKELVDYYKSQGYTIN
jgi:hypothetical protein